MNDIPAKRDELHQKEVYSPPSRRLSEQNAGGLHRRAFLAASAWRRDRLGGFARLRVRSGESAVRQARGVPAAVSLRSVQRSDSKRQLPYAVEKT